MTLTPATPEISLKKRIGFVVVLCLFFAGFQEVALRMIFPVPEVLNFNRIHYSSILHTPADAPRYLSNAKFIWFSEPDEATFVHTLNLYGFRDKTWKVARDPGRKRALFIGDSIVEGFMANDNQTIPAGFARTASSRNFQLETLNLGVGASNLIEYYRLIGDAVPLFHPDYLFVVFYANDFNSVPEYDAAWLFSPFIPEFSKLMKPRLWHIIEYMNAKKTVPHVWHRSPFPFFAAAPDPRNPWSSPKFCAHANQFVSPAIADAMRRGRFNPYIVDFYGICKKVLRKPFDISPHLEALKIFADKNSCALFIVYIPFNHQVSDAYLPFHKEYAAEKNPTSLMSEQYQLHAAILKKSCSQHKIPFLDMTPVLRKREAEGKRLYWNYDTHFRGESYLSIGKTVYKWFEGKRKETE